MQLLIPKQQAIKILNDRLNELNSYPFNHKVWKSRTLLDLKQIFGVLGDQWLQISSLYFDTAIKSEETKKLNEGRDAARGLLNSYIDFINEYSSSSGKVTQINEQSYQQQYQTLLGKWNKFVPEYNSLLERHELQTAALENALNNLKQSETKNQNVVLVISKFKKWLLFSILLIFFSSLLWSFNSVTKWGWLSEHPKRIALYISFQLLILFSLLRIVTNNKAIKVIDLLIGIALVVLSII